MRVLVCTTPGQMEVKEVEQPRCGPGEALVAISYVGICGTDIHAFGGNQPYFSYPRVLGHELSGRIEAVGSDADRALIGHNAYVIPYLHCGKCAACQRGKTNCCQNMEVIGVHRDGGMADYLVVPVAHLVTSDILAPERLALVECLAIGAHAVRRSQLDAGELALVIGAGPIGMGVVQIAQSRGARVVVVDTNPQRLAFCHEVLGVETVINAATQDIAAELTALSTGALADVVFDATGNAQAMNRGFDFVGHGGRYVLVSLVKADITFHDPDFHKKEITLLASRNATHEDFVTVARLMEAGQLHEREMITHRSPLEAMPEIMAQWCDPRSGVIKGMIEVNGFARHAAEAATTQEQS
ncbi:zinc-binding alcohol dehydrogenase family protein [Phytohalomonas tamaricis]|uniref:zinc-binding alcohol dehydrogenase family protein n=1 Tax=Phytohalomonas tamaricis TaxID=2081032 RepID=UPI000D0BD91A|nr:zinc-binding alcohol dehydrogenase family protein [Phytohalomonas tamaricis]